MARLLTGLALLLAGLGLMAEGLGRWGESVGLHRRVADSAKESPNPVAGVALGAALTSLVQSSSAVTVILVGLRDAGLISLETALAYTIGANVGTCITAQIAAVDPGRLAAYLPPLGLLLACVGALEGTIFRKRYSRPSQLASPRPGPTTKRYRRYESYGWAIQYLGHAIAGLGFIFLGMSQMEKGSLGLVAGAFGRDMLRLVGHSNVAAFAAGFLATAVIQSSSAMVAATMAVSRSGAIDLERTVMVVLGANVGTCVTALLAGVGRKREALQVAVGHLLFNSLGVIVFLPLVGPVSSFIRLVEIDPARQVALAHLLFNGLTALMAIPALGALAKMVTFVCPSEETAAG